MRRCATLMPESVKTSFKAAVGVPSMESSLRRLKRNGFAPRVVIDVGAYRGEWTRLCKRLFPYVQVLMIEPQSGVSENLQGVTEEYVGVHIAQVLVGAQQSTNVGFYENDSGSSVLKDASRDRAPSLFMPMTTLDLLTQDSVFARPDFIKLDIQGFELSALQGGERALAAAEAVLIEVNLLPLYKDAPLFDVMVSFMSERGFQLYDVCTFFRRPYDQALWQMDVIFVRKSSSLLSVIRWS